MDIYCNMFSTGQTLIDLGDLQRRTDVALTLDPNLIFRSQVEVADFSQRCLMPATLIPLEL